jgi:hypothetical protein
VNLATPSASFVTRPAVLLAAIIALSVIARLGAAVYHGPTIEPLPGVTDQISYHELAVRVIDGHGFTFGTGWWPATRANQPTAHWSFLYVLFLAAVYTVAGPVPLVARVLQAVIVGILHPLLVWRVGNRVFGSAVGLVSAAMAGLYGYFIYYGGALVTESLYTVAFLWVLDLATLIAFAARDGRRSSARFWALLGLACGAATLLRQVFLLVLPLILVWMAWQMLRSRRGGRSFATLPALARGMALTVAIVAACVLPWTARNYRAFHEFVPLNTNAGFVFFWANHPVHGSSFIPILGTGPVNYWSILPREYRSLNEAQLDRALLRRGLEFVAQDPMRYVRLSISRAREYFRFWPSAETSIAGNVIRLLSFGLLAPLVLCGFVAAFLRRGEGDGRGAAGAVLLVVVAATYAAVHLLTWTLIRYRLPVDAIVMPFAGCCLVYLWQRLSSLPAFAGLAPSTGHH